MYGGAVGVGGSTCPAGATRSERATQVCGECSDGSVPVGHACPPGAGVFGWGKAEGPRACIPTDMSPADSARQGQTERPQIRDKCVPAEGPAAKADGGDSTPENVEGLLESTALDAIPDGHGNFTCAGVGATCPAGGTPMNAASNCLYVHGTTGACRDVS